MATRMATDRQKTALASMKTDLVTLAIEAKALGCPGADDFLETARKTETSLDGYFERGDLTFTNASAAVGFIADTLKQLRRITAVSRANVGKLPTAPKTSVTESDAGMYTKPDGTIIRVYFGQQSGQMLAKKVVKTGELNPDGSEKYGFEYLGLAARFIGDATKMSLDEAKKWGKATGTCCVCARRLDVPESVDAGIGPVCAGKF